jgi:hypothetical protein
MSQNQSKLYSFRRKDSKEDNLKVESLSIQELNILKDVDYMQENLIHDQSLS